MGERLHSPRYGRARVEETLTIANQMTDPECKRLLIGVAQTYAQLARLATRREDFHGDVGRRMWRLARKP